MWLCGAALLLCCGCASAPYRFGRFHPQEFDGAPSQPVAVNFGSPNKALDGLGWLVGLPVRILTLKWNASNHHVSDETVAKLKTYLRENDITDVYVAVNEYDPKGQWQRLRENDHISPVWRYSIGALSCVTYSIFPYRIIGGDEYNPFTNTLNLTSDVPAMLLSEAAYAKDVRSRKLPGAYATVNILPIVSLWRQSLAASDVVGYARFHDDWEGEKEVYCFLYPHIGATTFGPAAHFVPVAGPFLSTGGAIVGHVVGRTTAAIQQPESIDSAPGDDPVPVITEKERTDAKHRQQVSRPPPSEENAVLQAAFQKPSQPRPPREAK